MVGQTSASRYRNFLQAGVRRKIGRSKIGIPDAATIRNERPVAPKSARLYEHTLSIDWRSPYSMGSASNFETSDEPQKEEARSSFEKERPNRILCASSANPSVDKSLLDTYNAYLESKPVLTKALTAATVQGLGAALGSILSSPKRSENNSGQRRGPRIDWLEVFAFALHGGLLNGPIGHYW